MEERGVQASTENINQDRAQVVTYGDWEKVVVDGIVSSSSTALGLVSVRRMIKVF